MLDARTENAQKRFKYRKGSKLLRAPSHRVLGNLLHVTEEDEEYVAIIIGSDFELFKKGGLLKRVERKFIFAELSKDVS